jgi:hypothetical protein
MAQTKDKHYWTQLRAALTGGCWGSSTPAKNFKGSPISWTELLRKFNKHCHGHTDVSEIADRTQALALLVAGIPTDGELDGDGLSGEDSLSLGAEGVVVGEHADEARVGLEALRNLESEHANSDVRLWLLFSSLYTSKLSQSLKHALAYYYYALENPVQCLSYLSQVHDIANAQVRLDAMGSLRSSASSASTRSTSDNTSSVSFIGSFVSSESASIVADVADGRAWAATEVVRSVCLQGDL